MNFPYLRLGLLIYTALLPMSFPLRVEAQAPLPLYTERLVNAFQDWSWGTRNLANTSPTLSNVSYSVSLNGTAWNVALSLYHPDFNATVYSNLVFWGNGGTNGGQVLQVSAGYGTNAGPTVRLAALPANAWTQYTVSLSSLGVANATNLNKITLQLTSYGTTNVFYLDQVQLTGKAAPALVHVNLNNAQTVRTVDSRWAAFNTAIWDGNFDTPTTISLLREVGAHFLRFPGGSLSDEYHWATGRSLTNTWAWPTSFTNFMHVATNVGAQAIITVNYGTGTPQEAAGWVRNSNVTNHLGFKYWEVGNECYGTWETDSNTFAHDPYTYATNAVNYLQQMRAADPTIKIGVVVVPGEDSNSNGYSGHPATNSITGQVHNGWTPVVLSTLSSKGVLPDFLIHHVYPQYTASGSTSVADSDALVLQSTTGWPNDAADLRSQLAGYVGAAGTNIELLVTENNSDAGSQGRQSTSLVNGLYYVDSLGHVMQTEFNAYVWWDLRNGTDTGGSFDPSLYGWRTNGDLGIIGNLSTRYPAFYAAKMIQFFAQPGDIIIPASTDYILLSAYAARRASGAVSLLVLNKDTVGTFNGQVNLGGFVPYSAATLRSFGIPQDETARTNGPAAGQDIITNSVSSVSSSFSWSFAPLSLSLFTFAPAAPTLIALAPTQPGQFVGQLQGQANVRFIIQQSSDLRNWSNILTNTLSSSSWTFTNTAPATGAKFWRGIWLP
jgi:hypothetical protein